MCWRAPARAVETLSVHRQLRDAGFGDGGRGIAMIAIGVPTPGVTSDYHNSRACSDPTDGQQIRSAPPGSRSSLERLANRHHARLHRQSRIRPLLSGAGEGSIITVLLTID